ncbi:MAG: hypothetical protein ACTHLO_01935 [Pseudolabrys sp.]|jgi:hypothetical protein|nr:hypothetical protein [Pseudolabrys sp.]HEX2537728.1 hypothetical protein [Pseudolabrys sp.]
MATLVTEADLARARTDPAFRHQLMAQSLEALIAALHRARRGEFRPETVRQIKEGTDLAMTLADRIQQIKDRHSAGGQGPKAA